MTYLEALINYFEECRPQELVDMTEVVNAFLLDYKEIQKELIDYEHSLKTNPPRKKEPYMPPDVKEDLKNGKKVR